MIQYSRETRFGSKWDKRFQAMCREVGTWSKDPKRQVGSVIVRPDRTVASVGFNGFPRGMPDNSWRYRDKSLKQRFVVHAEMNAALSANEPIHGFTVYTYPYPPCVRCAVHLAQAGIQTAVLSPIPHDTREHDIEDFTYALYALYAPTPRIVTEKTKKMQKFFAYRSARQPARRADLSDSLLIGNN